jgi:hypothetical protein
MAAVFTLHNFLLVALAAAVLLAVAGVCRDTTEGALPRYLRGRRYHRSGRARHADYPTAPSALETVPDAPVSPFAPRTFA